MLVDGTDLKELDDTMLSRINSQAYEAKIKAMREYSPMADFIKFIKNLLAKRQSKK